MIVFKHLLYKIELINLTFRIFEMKKTLIAGLMAASALCAGATDLFFYSPEKGDGGLRFAVRENGGAWR